jgi:hypothetical protein
MNEKHQMIGNIGGQCKVLDWVVSDLDPRIYVPTYQSIEAFKQRYADIWVPTLDGRKQMGHLWLEHRDKAKYDGVAFEPGGNEVLVGNRLNLWRGWGVEPQPGDWSRLRWHIEHVLAGGNAEMADYILRWIAWGIQRPGRKRGVALVLRGPEGAGKGIFLHGLLKIYGSSGMYITQPSQLVGKFNVHLMTLSFVFADEVSGSMSLQEQKVLMTLITDPSLVIEKKGADPFARRNWLDFALSSNEDWIVPAGPNARRYAVSDTSSRYAKDFAPEPERKEYFRALQAEMDGGGLAAMMWDLAQLELGDWTPEDVPVTNALIEQKRHSLRGFDRWYESCLQLGQLPRSRDDWGIGNVPANCATTHAILEAVKACDLACREETPDAVKIYLRQRGMVDEDGGNTNWRVGGSGRAGCKFPPLDVARKRFARRFGGAWPWDEDVKLWWKDGCEGESQM